MNKNIETSDIGVYDLRKDTVLFTVPVEKADAQTTSFLTESSEVVKQGQYHVQYWQWCTIYKSLFVKILEFKVQWSSDGDFAPSITLVGSRLLLFSQKVPKDTMLISSYDKANIINGTQVINDDF
jgi:hypothetical protein